MQGFPPAPGDQVTLKNWLLPGRLRWSQRNFRSLAPTHDIAAPARPARYGRGRSLDLQRMMFINTQGEPASVQHLLDAPDTDALLLVHRNRIVGEHYRHGMDASTLHSCMSATKSTVGLVVAKLVHEGWLDVDATLASYMPELAGQAYGGATVRNLLDMRSGVQWGGSDSIQAMGWEPGLRDSLEVVMPQVREMLAMPSKSRNAMLATAIEGELPRPPVWPPFGSRRGIYRAVRRARQLRPHGGHFNYRAGETNALGWLCERVTGVRMADLMQHYLWQPLGMEANAAIVVDAVGTAMHEGGLMATLRDAGRLGGLLLDGRNLRGKSILPAEWLQDARQLEAGNRAASGVFIGKSFAEGGYRSHLWVPNPQRGSLLAYGANGQLIYADPQSQLVAVVFSSWPAPMSRTSTDWLRAFEAIAERLPS